MDISQPMLEWIKWESKEPEWNSNGLYAIIKAIIPNEDRRVQGYTTSKRAWDILETMHKGTLMVKRSRILKLNRNFELCTIEEDESFGTLYSRLYNVVNYLQNLGTHTNEEKQIEKINSCLPNHLHAKVIVIESMYKLGKLSITELVSNLQIFELCHLLPKQDQMVVGKEKTIAFKTTQGNSFSIETNAIVSSDESSSPN